jgi:hypothetical protein
MEISIQAPTSLLWVASYLPGWLPLCACARGISVSQTSTYVREPFHLDGRIDLDISFAERTTKTAVYVKMDGQNQLLLSVPTTLNRHVSSLH